MLAVSDKLTQNEIDELEGTLEESKTADTSMLRDLLDKVPDGFFGGKHESNKVNELEQNAANAHMENMSVSPREPEEFTLYVQNVFGQVKPAIEFHDEVMKGITSAIENIPVLPRSSLRRNCRASSSLSSPRQSFLSFATLRASLQQGLMRSLLAVRRSSTLSLVMITQLIRLTPCSPRTTSLM
jgi:Heterokaryon incompatibility protein Het-C